MSKRRIPQRTLTEIGEARMTRLLAMAAEAVREGRVDRARRYVELARRVSAKTQVPMPPDAAFCKGCGVPLMPGMDCTVRLSNHMVCVKCGICGRIHRRPYLKEQSHD